MKAKRILASITAIMITFGSLGMSPGFAKELSLYVSAVNADEQANEMINYVGDYGRYYDISLNVTVTGGNAALIRNRYETGDYYNNYEIIKLKEGTSTIEHALYYKLNDDSGEEFGIDFYFDGFYSESSSYYDGIRNFFPLEDGITVKINYAIVNLGRDDLSEVKFSGAEVEKLINGEEAISDNKIVKAGQSREYFSIDSNYLYGKGLTKDNYGYNYYYDDESDEYEDYVYFKSYNGDAQEIVVPSYTNYDDYYIDRYPIIELADDAFADAENLKKVTLPEGIEKIGDHALGYKKSYDENGEPVYTKISGFTIVGYSDSIVEWYAKKNGLNFVSLGTNTKVPHFEYEEITEWDDETESSVETGTIRITDYLGYNSDVTIPEKIDGYTVAGIDWDIFKNHTEIDTLTVEPDIGISLSGKSLGYIENESTYEHTKDDNLTIVGYGGVTLERYAIENGFEFISNEKKSSEPIFEYDTVWDDYEEDEEGNDISKPVGIYLVDYYGTDSKLVIPETYDGYKVLGLHYYFCNNDPIVEEVVFPENEIDIHMGTFMGSKWQKNLDLKQGEYGYYYAKINDYYTYKTTTTNKDSFEQLPDGSYLVGRPYNPSKEPLSLWQNSNLITNIDGAPISVLGYGTLWCCERHSDKDMNDYTYHESYYDEDNDKWYDSYYENKETGEKLSLSDFWSVNTLTIPNGVKYIAENAFCNHGLGDWNCYDKIRKIELPDSLLAIESGWFMGECLNGLESIDLPQNLKYLGDKAFMGTQIKSSNYTNDISLVSQVTIPESLEYIGKNALGYYTVINLDSNTTTIEKIPGFKIYCYANTAGEQYAIDNGFEYVLLEKPDRPVSGKITQAGSTDLTGTEITLIDSQGKEYTAKVSADGTFSADGLTSGKYTLTAAKENCAPRAYNITVGEKPIELDVELHLYGDVNADGKITVSDVAKVNSHVKKKAELTDYDFAVADVNKDGKLSVSDSAKINAHMRGKSSLWI